MKDEFSYESGHEVGLVSHVVLADGRVVYAGLDIEEMREAFLSAGRSKAKCVSHFVNGVEVAFSYLITEASQ